LVKLSRILRDYDEAGSLNELIALWGFVDDHAFLTKAGHLGLTYEVRGVDYEGLTHQQRQALVHQVEAGMRMLDERCRLYQYVLKRAMDPIVPAACHLPVANEAIQRRATYLNARRHQLSDTRARRSLANGCLSRRWKIWSRRAVSSA
jgi:type IV secretory pathway VirB4 component